LKACGQLDRAAQRRDKTDPAIWIAMPTLIRLSLFLLFIAGLGFAGMIALTVMVNPDEKDITIKIPARELTPASQPIDLNNLPAPVNVAPKDAPSGASASQPASADPSIDLTDTGASASGVKTVDVGGGE
jgi:hypothetical protein